MAKYNILMSCGHEEEVALFGANSEREKKIQYLKTYGLCKVCYKEHMNEKESEEPLNFNATVLPVINAENGKILLNVWFSGNTKSHKDEIKGLGGYRWRERQSAADTFSLKKPPMCWNKLIELEELPEEIAKAKSIGAESIVHDSGLFASANYQIAAEAQKEWQEKYAQMAEVKKPVLPDFLAGHKWNKKVYGRRDNAHVYLDEVKTPVSEEQIREIKNYLEEEEKYQKEIAEIKKRTVV